MQLLPKHAPLRYILHTVLVRNNYLHVPSVSYPQRHRDRHRHPPLRLRLRACACDCLLQHMDRRSSSKKRGRDGSFLSSHVLASVRAKMDFGEAACVMVSVSPCTHDITLPAISQGCQTPRTRMPLPRAFPGFPDDDLYAYTSISVRATTLF